jgi:hypothetical protein
MGWLLGLLLLGGIVAVLYFVTSPRIARDRRVRETASILALAFFAVLVGQALTELADGAWKHSGPSQLTFYAAGVAYLLFSLIRNAWSRDR